MPVISPNWQVLKVAILAEKYAVDYSWYVDTILNLIRIAGDYVSEEVWYRVLQIVTNRDDVQGYAAKTVFEVSAPTSPTSGATGGARTAGAVGSGGPALPCFLLFTAVPGLCQVSWASVRGGGVPGVQWLFPRSQRFPTRPQKRGPIPSCFAAIAVSARAHVVPTASVSPPITPRLTLGGSAHGFHVLAGVWVQPRACVPERS